MSKAKIKLSIGFFMVTLFAVTLHMDTAFALSTLYEFKTEETITKGTTYQSYRQVTDEGLRDVYVLKVPITDPNIGVGAAESTTDYGFKETVQSLLTENGAIAGVNGDFFGIKGTHSLSFGPVFKDSKLVSVATSTNKDKNEYASFYINKDNNPFILYLKTEIEFLNDGKKNIDVVSVNKVTDMVFPIIINRQAMDSTQSLDARFPGLLKVVAEGGKITYVSKKGETVNVPQNGFVLVIGEASADYFGQFYKVGQTAEVKLKAGMDFGNIATSIGGGGRILLDGQIVHDTGMVAKGRQPRTALGISQDKTHIILVVVDGRTHSIGATHDEMGELMLRFGAYNAMHLDGGGSSTMAVKSAGDNDVKMVNTPSDGASRKVINAMGIYNKAPAGAMTKLIVKASGDKILKGVPSKIEIYGLDDYYNKIQIPRSEITLVSDDPEGAWQDDYYITSRAGAITFVAWYGALSSGVTLISRDLVELRPNIKTIKASPNDQVNLMFNGVDVDGDQTFIASGVQYEIAPPGLGVMENSTFIASGSGSGYIKCSIGNVSTYIDVYIGEKNIPLHYFEGDRVLQFFAYPEGNVTGAASYSTTQTVGGQKSAQMSYQFSAIEGTQAAYMGFTEPIQIPENPIGLKLDVWGNQSNLWLRGRIKDANGTDYAIDFAKNVDWDGWKTVTAKIPADVTYPITLERLYLASLSLSEPIRGDIFFDNLVGTYPVDEVKVALPDSPKFSDPLKVSLKEAPANGSFDITLVGDVKAPKDTKPNNYKAVQNKVMEQFKKFTKRVLYAGETDLPLDMGVGVYQWNTTYLVHAQDNAAIVHMSAEKGGLISTDPSQWAKFVNNIASSGKEHIIIVMDKSPLSFSQPKEYELFQDALVSLRKTGKNIFVVSTEGTQTTSSLKKGIRYMNVGGLWNEDGTMNSDFRLLRFRINGNQIQYDFQALEN